MSQIESSRKQVKTVVGATLDRVPAWSDAVGGAARTTVVRKKRADIGFEQPELWSSAPSSARRMETSSSDRVSARTVEEVPFIDVKQVRPAVPVPVKTPARAPVRRAAPAPSVVVTRGVPVQKIARFLNVNGAIEGMKPSGMRFDLPGRGLSQTLRLWRQTSETSTFTSVAY